MSQKAKNTGCKLLRIRYRYLILLATALGGGYLTLYSRSEGAQILILSHNRLGNYRHYEGDHDVFNTIRTEGCIIPGLQARDPIIKDYIDPRRQKHVKPCKSPYLKLHVLVKNETHIWINQQIKDLFLASDLRCCYSAFRRPEFIVDIDSPRVDKRVKYFPCVYFFNYISVQNEFVKVTCYENNEIIHIEYFIFALKKPFFYHSEDIKNNSSRKNLYNVLVLGIDSVSRLNFHRTMPKTLAYLRKKGAVELRGYNKVHDNTFPNLIPMLLGITVEEMKKTCWPHDKARFDNCPFIWESFKSEGYYTAFIEDSADLALFNFRRQGFVGTPTDYYTYTFVNQAETHVGNNKDYNSVVCLGNKYSYEILLEYVKSLTSIIHPDKLFGFYWETTMTHDFLNYPSIMDSSYEALLKNMDETKVLDKTILILMSDHGLRWGSLRLTKQGRLEERLPIMEILVPQSFREKFEHAFGNLKANSHRLVTPFDMYATLLDLLNLEDINDTNILSRSKGAYSNNRSISLFLPIPKNRTCALAGIKEHWCTCHSGQKLPPQSDDAKSAAMHLMSNLNAQLAEYKQCAQLKLAEVIEVSELWVGQPDKNEMVGFRDFLVIARATPGDGVFEATLRNTTYWTLAGSASRLNLYGDQSRCIHNTQLKLYCFCK